MDRVENVQDPQTEPEPQTEPASGGTSRRSESSAEREYVVLREEADSHGAVWEIVHRGAHTSRQEALEHAYAKEGPADPDATEPRVLVAVPGSYFKPVSVRVETVRQVKWEDG